MILNEKAVCDAMKRDVKGAGYRAFGIDLKGDHWLGLKGSSWIVLAALKNVPRKVLGLLAEHAGGIPGVGTAWEIEKPRKGNVQRQDVMFGIIEQELRELLDTQWDLAAKLGRMGLTLDGYGLWQNRENLSILRLRPEDEAMAEWNGTAHMSGEWVCKCGFVSWCFVNRLPWSGEHEAWRKHLEKMSWA